MKKRVVVFLILLVLLTASIGVSCFFFLKYRKEKKEYKEYKDKQVELQKNNTDELKEKIKTDLENGVGTINTLRNVFDEDVVLYDSGKFKFIPINTSLKKNTINNDNLVTDDDGSISYVVNGENKGHKGIDVSKFQGDIDWEKVKADGVEFAIIRVGYRGYGSGEIVEDEKAKQNLEGATKAGIKVGVYFYSQAITVEEGIEEADFVLKLIKDYDITYPVVFDTEPVSEGVSRMDDLTGDEISDIAVEFCKRIENKGYKPMIYANLRWFLLTLNCDKLEGYDKWFAGYDKTLYFPYEIKMWQYSETGYVDGIDTQVDLDICFSDYE